MFIFILQANISASCEPFM